MFGLGPSELLIVGIVAILLFGKNLPQVAAKLGRTYRDFRRSLSDLQSQVDITGEFTNDPPRSKPKPRAYSDYDDYDDISAPKFEPPPAPPEPSSGEAA